LTSVKSYWKDGLRTVVYKTRMYGGVRGALRQLMAEPSTRLCNDFYSNLCSGLETIISFIIS